MSQVLDHECIICGEKYHHCNDCGRMKDFKPWRAVACSIECYQVYLAYMDYKEGNLTEKQMADILIERGFDRKTIRPELQEKFDHIIASVRTPAGSITAKLKRKLAK